MQSCKLGKVTGFTLTELMVAMVSWRDRENREIIVTTLVYSE